MKVSEFWRRQECSSLSAGFSTIFSFFSLENPSFEILTILKLEKSDFTQKMERKLNLFTLSHRKVLDVEI